ncbi:MAG: MbnH family di-heme enzyme, partial [Pseudomonadota bacterium]
MNRTRLFPKVLWLFRVGGLALLSFVLTACDHSGKIYEWDLPTHFPMPNSPTNPPMTQATVELGRHLFYDTRLSINGRSSCANCHHQSRAFTDALPRAVGATGELHPRSAMSLTNVAYNTRFAWAHHLLDTLEAQALVPLFGENPVEMGLSGQEQRLLTTLGQDEKYQELFHKAFPDNESPFSVSNIARAIADFERTLISADAPYDRYLQGDETALSDSAKRGMNLFLSERLECFHCHGGFNFTDSTDHVNVGVQTVAFHNTGLYNLDDAGTYPSDNTGVYELTHKPEDMGHFKAPTLRNIAVTAPYMHDG